MKNLEYYSQNTTVTPDRSRREIIKSSPEHTELFLRSFEIKPEYADHPECKLAFDYAAHYKLTAQEVDYIGAIIQRKSNDSKAQDHTLPREQL